MHRSLYTTLIAAAGAAACVASSSTVTPQAAPREDSVYLFSYFTDNGQDGLHLAASTNGLDFVPLGEGRSFFKPTIGEKIMRDPSIVLGFDGSYHMVWTTGWWQKGIGVAHSKDLVNWTGEARIGVMDDEPLARNTWAPEIYRDDATKQYLIFWSTAIPGRFPASEENGDKSSVFGGNLNHRVYVVTTKDFVTYSKPRLFYDDGFPVIDANMIRAGNEYILVMKDETKFPEAKKNLRIARSSQAEGPFSKASLPFTDSWVEGPSIARVGDQYVVYYDEYTRHKYGAMASRDLEHWAPVTVTFPQGARHGTVFRAPASALPRIR